MIQSPPVEELSSSYAPWFVRAIRSEVPKTFNSIKTSLKPNPDAPPVPLSAKLQKGVNFVKTGDMFGFSPIVKLDSFRSLVGGFLTLCCFTCIFIYIVWTSLRYFGNPVNKAQVVLDADPAGIETPRVGVVFTSGSGAVLNDDTIAYFTMSMVIIFNSNNTDKISTPLTLVSNCSYYLNVDVGFNPTDPNAVPTVTQATCFSLQDYPLESVGNISGTFESGYYRYLEVDLYACVGVSPSGRNCTDMNTINSILANAQVQVMWYNTEVRDVIGVDPHLKLTRVWRSYRFRFAPPLVVEKDVYITKTLVDHHSAWPLGLDDIATAYREGAMIDSYTNFNPSKPRLMEFIFRTDPRMVNEQWTPNLVFDLIGSWGALWSSLLLIVGIPAAIYNERKWNFLLQENKLKLENVDSPVLSVLEKSIARSSVKRTASRRDTNANPLATITNFLRGKSHEIPNDNETTVDLPLTEPQVDNSPRISMRQDETVEDRTNEENQSATEEVKPTEESKDIKYTFQE